MVRENRKSALLEEDENQLLFTIMGPRCQAQSTTVVQLYGTMEPEHNEWHKLHTGILVLTKDFLRKDYFLRIYCLETKKKVWEHGFYNKMEYVARVPYLHMFEGENGVFAFNFACLEEAQHFQMNVNKTQNLINEKLEPTKPPKPVKEESNMRDMNSQQNITTSGAISKINTNNNAYFAAKTKNSKKSKKSKKNKNKTRPIISDPINFQHISHVSFDEHGIISSGNSEVEKFLKEAGLDRTQLRNKKISRIVNTFFEEHGGEDIVMSKQAEYERVSLMIPRPQTVQKRKNNAPINMPPPPPLPTIPRVQPIQPSPNIPLPPLPPTGCPVSNNIPPPLPIMVEEEEDIYNEPVSDGRSNLLRQIQEGITLKKVEERVVNNTSSSSTNQNTSNPSRPTDMISLLKEKLNDRRININDSDAEEDDSENEWSC